MELSSGNLQLERDHLIAKTEALNELYDKCADELAASMQGAVVEKEALQRVLNEKTKELESCQAGVAELGKAVSLAQKCKPKNFKMKISRRDHKINTITEAFKNKQDLLESCERRLAELVAEASVFGQERRKLMLQSSYLKKKLAKANPGTTELESVTGARSCHEWLKSSLFQEWQIHR